MEHLMNRVIYHPLVAFPTFYVVDLMYDANYSLSAALVALAIGLALRLLRHFNAASQI
jgi:hypothetical protein